MAEFRAAAARTGRGRRARQVAAAPGDEIGTPSHARGNAQFRVLGLGGFDSTEALELARFGNRVIGADLDERKVSRLLPQLHSAIILDATDEAAMREAGIDRYDVALVAIVVPETLIGQALSVLATRVAPRARYPEGQVHPG